MLIGAIVLIAVAYLGIGASLPAGHRNDEGHSRHGPQLDLQQP
jgi:hypothetical protein